MSRRTAFALVALALAVSAGCAAGPNPLLRTAGERGVAGFWAGLWHGIICPITFLVSLFNSNVHIYEVHNSGRWYEFGFILGASSSLGGAGRAAPRRD